MVYLAVLQKGQPGGFVQNKRHQLWIDHIAEISPAKGILAFAEFGFVSHAYALVLHCVQHFLVGFAKGRLRGGGLVVNALQGFIRGQAAHEQRLYFAFGAGKSHKGSHANLDEFVLIAGKNTQKAQPLHKRRGVVAGFLQYSFVKAEPAQFPVVHNSRRFHRVLPRHWRKHRGNNYPRLRLLCMMDLLQLRGASPYLPMRRARPCRTPNKKGARLCMADAPMGVVRYVSR